ncbi:type I methionyl aminopeptidase [Chitinophaga sancti]|uniref:Methionine aminopeptidase n=1 Tax=Chitinophaga sancti TaxID=1004 RepID=A0A1K1P0E8_9BACT|nr:type I methionyl aminopeptidase [Chitinophaga sancti]WQD60357.1 type I methionyl aminopeptidase [Chitinophaga sancti]WQG87515.1 type I methionyl aminopeptidase [Chitinophaga sancti]SFW40963.1 methionyl aminopeptidase [Chitinophaga sancti]
MSITSTADLSGMQAISEVVGKVLQLMRQCAAPGMSTKELDEYGGALLTQMGARSAPKLTYNFPGFTCISVNNEVAHGIPSAGKILQPGDLVNIDVSGELAGYYADNGASFVLGEDLFRHTALINASIEILHKAISNISDGVRLAHIGRIVENAAKEKGYKVIRNLVGHGIGRSLHEAPREIPNFYDRFNRNRFRSNSVVAIETFISTGANYADTLGDGWTLVTKDGSFVAQHEHTVLVTSGEPIILTASNGI